jgi:hypothetical protein
MSLFACYAAAVAILKTIAEAWTWAMLPPVTLRHAMHRRYRPDGAGSSYRPALPTTEEVQRVRSV